MNNFQINKSFVYETKDDTNYKRRLGLWKSSNTVAIRMRLFWKSKIELFRHESRASFFIKGDLISLNQT